jgi:hypothetical protein
MDPLDTAVVASPNDVVQYRVEEQRGRLPEAGHLD